MAQSIAAPHSPSPILFLPKKRIILIEDSLPVGTPLFQIRIIAWPDRPIYTESPIIHSGGIPAMRAPAPRKIPTEKECATAQSNAKKLAVSHMEAAGDVNPVIAPAKEPSEERFGYRRL